MAYGVFMSFFFEKKTTSRLLKTIKIYKNVSLSVLDLKK